MSDKRKWQLVLQFRSESIESFDRMIELEERLAALIEPEHTWDGHDSGSGTVNFFVFTDEVTDAFKRLALELRNAAILDDCVVAYRKRDVTEEELISDDLYKVIWPQPFSGRFEVL